MFLIPTPCIVRIATVREKIFFQDHGKVREFCYKSVKMSFFETVRENQSWSGNVLFFIFIFYFYFENFHPQTG